MNNRWIYAVELVVFGWIAARGGWLAVRSPSSLGRAAGALALAAAVATVVLLGLFAANRQIPPLLHVTPLVGVALVFTHETARAARTVPGWTAPFVGLYSTLALGFARRERPASPPVATSETDHEEGGAP